jgi:hypothetical protein
MSVILSEASRSFIARGEVEGSAVAFLRLSLTLLCLIKNLIMSPFAAG